MSIDQQKTPDELKQDQKESANKNLEKDGNGKDFLKTATDYAEGMTKNAEDKFAKIPEESKVQFQGECIGAKKTLEYELTAIANDPKLKNSEERNEKMAEAIDRYLDTVSKAYAKAMGGQLTKDKDTKEKDLFDKEKSELKNKDWSEKAKDSRKAQEEIQRKAQEDASRKLKEIQAQNDTKQKAEQPQGNPLSGIV